MSHPKILLHWLSNSRSHRILWLLEELDLSFDVKLYQRDRSSRAPPELQKVHSLGKAPILEVNGRALAESGHIVSYVIENFDKSGRLKPSTEDDKEEVDYYLHYAEGTLEAFLVQVLVLDVAKKSFPFLLKPILNKAFSAVENAYAGPEIARNLGYLEKKLEGKKYFVGEKLTGADIILSFPLENVANSKGAEFVERKYPNIAAWLQRIHERDAYKKANEKAKL